MNSLQHEVIAKFELTHQGWDMFLQKYDLETNQKVNLGKGNIGRYRKDRIWNLSFDGKDKEHFLGVDNLVSSYTALLRLKGRNYKIYVPKQSPVELVFTSGAEIIKHPKIQKRWVYRCAFFEREYEVR